MPDLLAKRDVAEVCYPNNDNGSGNEDGCYGSGRGQANGNGNGNCPGQGVANGHDPNHDGGTDEDVVLATPLLLLALVGCERRMLLRRGRRAA